MQNVGKWSKNLKPQLQLPRLIEGPNIRERSYCDSITGSMQCSSLTSKNSEKHSLFENDGLGNGPLKNAKDEPERVSLWLKTTNRKNVKAK